MGILEERAGKEYDSFTKEYEVTTTETRPEPLPEVDLEEAVYGAREFDPTWKEIKEAAQYAPTRFEYFAGLALQGLVTGRAERDLKTAVRKSLDLAKEMETLLDSEEG